MIHISIPKRIIHSTQFKKKKKTTFQTYILIVLLYILNRTILQCIVERPTNTSNKTNSSIPSNFASPGICHLISMETFHPRSTRSAFAGRGVSIRHVERQYWPTADNLDQEFATIANPTRPTYTV